MNTTRLLISSALLVSIAACKSDSAAATSNPESVSAEVDGEGVAAGASNVDGASAVASEEDGSAMAQGEEDDEASAEVTDDDDHPE